MFLEQIKLTNLLSFGGDSSACALDNLNIIIGPNGSGKSNILEAIDLLRSAPEQVVRPIRGNLNSGCTPTFFQRLQTCCATHPNVAN